MISLTHEQKMAKIFTIVMILMHVGALGFIFTGVSKFALLVAFIMYLIRGMGITIGYHRYFSHKSFKTSRVFQFILAICGTLASEGGVLWWSSHHRAHHKYSDTQKDLHSPLIHGFFHSHLGWMFSPDCFKRNEIRCHDLAKYPELKFLNKFYPGIMLFQVVFFYFLGFFFSSYGTDGWQMLVWGFFISTVFTWHCTFMVNSVCHIWGSRRFKDSGDKSRNNLFVALFSFGEGWHNNHHKFGWSARNGLKWWEIDTSYYVLKILAFFRIVKDLRIPVKSEITIKHDLREPSAVL